MNNLTILIVDDNTEELEICQEYFKGFDYVVKVAKNGEQALQIISKNKIDVVLSDLIMPRIDGIELIKKIKKKNKDIEVIIMTGYGSIQSAIEAMKAGAYHYILKPFNLEEIRFTLDKIIEKKSLYTKLSILQKEIEGMYSLDNLIIGRSKKTTELKNLISLASNNDFNVLITGEDGTGKEIIAKCIHHNSIRQDNAFVPVYINSIPASLFIEEIFGYDRNSNKKNGINENNNMKPSLIQQAGNGTLFFDDISKLSISLQKEMIGFFTSKMHPSSYNRSETNNIRIICSANNNLHEEITRKYFIEELYNEINTITIHIPALRERQEDIPVLVSHFTEKFRKKLKVGTKRFTSRALQKLVNYDWPGNIRELENTIERLISLSRGIKIDVSDLPANIVNSGTKTIISEFEKVPLKKTEEEYIKKILSYTNWNKSEASKILGITRETLYKKIARYNIKRPAKVKK